MKPVSPAVLSASSLLSPFYPSLDGLRGVAFLAVFAIHFATMVSTAAIYQWGWIGVDIFFVLSGFLITGILYESLDKPDFFSGFYIRRALRIFPLFYGFWFLVLLLAPVLHIYLNRYNISMIAYFGNTFYAGSHMGLHANPGLLAYASARHPGQINYINASHLWSLCLEEQFYLAWPLAVWLIRSRRTLLRVCLCVIVLEPMLRALYAHSYPAETAAQGIYFATFSRIDAMLMGGAVALWLRGPATTPLSSVRRRCYGALITAPLLLAALLRGFHHRISTPQEIFADPIVVTIGFTLIAIAAAALLLLTLDPSTRIAGLLRMKPLAALGRISYGMYFFHGFLAPVFASNADRFNAHHAGWLMVLLAFAVTYVLASLSFRFYESPFLRLKSRLAPRPGTVTDPPPYGLGSAKPGLVPEPIQ